MAGNPNKSKKDAVPWALILGGSKGLGVATARKLAQHGYNLLIVHRDRRTDLPAILETFESFRGLGRYCHSFNTDATRKEKQEEILGEIGRILGDLGKIRVMVHSIAKGSLRIMAGPDQALTGTDIEITLQAMAVSFYQWGKALLDRDLITSDARMIAFTSEGSSKALPGYGAVGAAKACLESLCRNMALEWAPLGIRVNCVQAGVTETESFKQIPGSDRIRDIALRKNPSGRLTQPSDAADVAYLLTLKEAGWITGTVIKADGGESLG